MHRYRFKHAFDEIIRSDGKDNNVLKEANAKVCRAIKGHKKAIELVLLHIRQLSINLYLTDCFIKRWIRFILLLR